MKTLSILLVVLLLSSCNIFKKTDDQRFNDLEKPVIVAAKSGIKLTPSEERVYIFNHCEVKSTITLKDGKGNFITFDGSKGIGAALYSTYNVKDTIK